MHARTAIRDAAVALVTNLATTGARVHVSRMRPQDPADLPCLLVQTNDEKADPESIDGIDRRTLRVTFVGVARGTGDVDATLNSIAEEVETAIGPGVAVLGVTLRANLANIETEFDDSLDQPIGHIRINYDLVYFTAAGTPGAFA